MAEYIERTEELALAVNAGARAIENTKRYHGATYCMDAFSGKPKEIPYLKAAQVLRGFDELPAADVAPVVRGRWIERRTRSSGKGGLLRDCSVCGENNMNRKSNYCPNCGAKMGDD